MDTDLPDIDDDEAGSDPENSGMKFTLRFACIRV